MFGYRVGFFGDGGSNGAIFDSIWNKFKMAAAAILDNFEWPYLRNGYLYSAHRAVIFAIAQLSCYINALLNLPLSRAVLYIARPSVRLPPFVRPSVTRVDQSKTIGEDYAIFTVQ